MKKIFSILLVVAIVFCSVSVTALADSFTLRNGIQFGDSYETVKSKETAPFSESESDDSIIDGDIHQVFTQETTVAGIDGCTIMFRFSPDDQLNEMKYSYSGIDSKDVIENNYETIFDGLVRKYGTPLNNKNGSCHLITTNALESSITIIGLLNAFSIESDYIDYDEWIVDLNNDNHVKIDMISYYSGDYSNRSYTLNIGYKLFTNDDLLTAVADKNEQQSVVDNDL